MFIKMNGMYINFDLVKSIKKHGAYIVAWYGDYSCGEMYEELYEIEPGEGEQAALDKVMQQISEKLSGGFVITSNHL